MGMAFWGALKDYGKKAVEESLLVMRESSDTAANEADDKRVEAERISDVELVQMNGHSTKINPPRS